MGRKFSLRWLQEEGSGGRWDVLGRRHYRGGEKGFAVEGEGNL